MRFAFFFFLFLATVNVWAAVWPTPGQFSKLPVYGQSDLPYDIASIAPKRFRIAEKQDIQPLVDRLVEKVFESSTTKKSLCFLAEGELASLQTFLGITLQSAKRIQKSCANQQLTDKQRLYLERMEFSFGVGKKGRAWTDLGMPPWERGKRYLFILAAEGVSTVSGYTQSFKGLTLFFIPKEGISEIDLVRLMAHELAVSFDKLITVGDRPSGDAQWEGWDFSELYGGSVGTSPFEPVQDPRALRCALTDPALRYALIIERASRFEDRVIRDLKVTSSESPNQATWQDCRGTLAHWASLQTALAEMTTFELIGLIDDCGNPAKDPHRAQTVADRINLLADMQIRVSKTRETLGLCDILTETQVGFRRASFSRSGPRPRVGGWSSLVLNLDDGTSVRPQVVDENLNLLINKHELDFSRMTILNKSLLTSDPMQGAPNLDAISNQIQSGKAGSIREAVDQLTVEKSR